MKTLHVLPIVGASAPQDLLLAQELTLRSIEIARKFSISNDVDVVGSRYFDEVAPVDWIIDYPCLSTSFSDLCQISNGPRLPLLREVFLPLQDLTGYDIVIFSNIDIGFQPYFYELVQQWNLDGLDAVNVTRRNLDLKIRNADLIKAWSTNGSAHPGSDCFIFSPKIAKKLILGNVAMGLPPVGTTLALNLWLHSKAYRKFLKQHATFHIGADMDWNVNPIKLKMLKRNREEAFSVIGELANRYGFGTGELLRQPPEDVLKAARLLG